MCVYDFAASTGVILENELLLHEAVITNDAETVRRLIEEDAGALNVDCRNNVIIFIYLTHYVALLGIRARC